MNGEPSRIRLTVVAMHAAERETSAVDRLRRGMGEVVERVQARLGTLYPSLGLEVRVVNSTEASEVGDWRSSCAVAVLDASAQDEGLVLQAGRLQGSGVATIVVCESGSEAAARRLGRGMGEPLVYGSMEELFAGDSAFEGELFRAVPQARILEELVYQFWFPRETSTIWVVCPQDHEPSEYADKASPDYTYLDNLGDEDALLELMVFLSRHYPNATISHFSSADLPDGHAGGNLVVLGGPGSASSISNRLCGEMMEAIQSRVCYSDDCERMSVRLSEGRSVELGATYRDDAARTPEARPSPESRPHANGSRSRGARLVARLFRLIGWQHRWGQRRIREDIGYFARFPNPVNEECAVVLINGIHTTGVLGSARAFSDRREAMKNYNAVLASGAGAIGFECYFAVPVLHGQVRVPAVKSTDVFPVASAAPAADGAAAIGAEDALRRRRSVTVLFVAGDRGGSRWTQIQMPNEYHAIQEALRASKHPDAIVLGAPILAATRERLAMAYRSPAQVFHFTGHGGERSLSIIEDHGALANEAPLSASDLQATLKAVRSDILLCVLNACDSQELAEQLVDGGEARCAVGWPGKVADSVAIAFSRALYGALGDGLSVAEGVEVATLACGADVAPFLVPAQGAAVGPLVGEEWEEVER